MVTLFLAPLPLVLGSKLAALAFLFPLERICLAGTSEIVACVSEDKIWPSDMNLFASGLAAESCIGNCS